VIATSQIADSPKARRAFKVIGSGFKTGGSFPGFLLVTPKVLFSISLDFEELPPAAKSLMPGVM
jgi:hypothetical protein